MAAPPPGPLPLLLAAAAIASLAAAQPPAGHWGPPPPPGSDGYSGAVYGGPPGGGRIGDGPPDSASTHVPGFAPGFGRFGIGVDYDKVSHARLAHGVLASLAFVFFFPVGAILVRAFPGRTALLAHATFQVIGYAFFIAATGLGIWVTETTKFGKHNLLTKYHPIIGLAIFSLLFFQPISGILHHLGFRRHARRTIASHVHVWLGRALLTLGIVNGGLGLLLASRARRRASPAILRRQHIAYGVFAGVMWLLWVVFAVAGEVRRGKAPAKPKTVVRNDPPIPRAGPPVRRKDDDLYA